MQIDTQSQQALYERVTKWTVDLFGELIVDAKPDIPVIDFCYGPTSGRLVVGSLGLTDRPYVCITCLVTAENVKLTPEVTRFLLEKNAELCIGAFGVGQSGQILFSHSIYGDNFTKDDFKPLMKAVLTVTLATREMLLTGVGTSDVSTLTEPEARIH